jgi:dCMP deaminase
LFNLISKYNNIYAVSITDKSSANNIIYSKTNFSKKDIYKISSYMEMAEILSRLSHCVSKKVAAIIIKDGRIISTGINGTTSGNTNCDDIFDSNSFDRIEHHKFSELYEIHAEANAIARAASENGNLKNSDAYTTLSPCSNCAKLLASAGIKRIFFTEMYDNYIDNSWIDFLLKSNVSIYCLKNDNKLN